MAMRSPTANHHPPPHNATVFKPPTSIPELFAKLSALIISSFTATYMNLIIGTGHSSNIGIYLLFVAVTVIVVVVYDFVAYAIDNIGNVESRWNGTIMTLIDFIVLAMILISFQYGFILVLRYWARTGMTVDETIMISLIALMMIFAGYQYIVSMTESGAKAEAGSVDPMRESSPTPNGYSIL